MPTDEAVSSSYSVDYNFKHLGNPMRLPADIAHFERRSAPELVRYGFTSLYRVCFGAYSRLFLSAIY